MRYNSIFIFLFFLSLGTQAQKKKESLAHEAFSIYKVQPNLKGDFSFTQNWDYAWWIIKSEDGYFENTMGEFISNEDTIHLYHTANVITSHQGEHPIRYVEAILNNDTLFLDFADLDAAYQGWLQIRLIKDKFSSQWICNYIMKVPKEKITYTILKQELILTTNQFEVGKKIKGKIDIQFQENFSAPNHPSTSHTYFVKGYFETEIQANFKN